MSSVASRSVQYKAILGDLQHKTDVYILIGDFGPVAEQFFSNSHQADYIRQQRPDLLPENPSQPPSDHQIGTIFEFYYFVDPYFRSVYLAYIRRLL